MGDIIYGQPLIKIFFETNHSLKKHKIIGIQVPPSPGAVRGIGGGVPIDTSNR